MSRTRPLAMLAALLMVVGVVTVLSTSTPASAATFLPADGGRLLFVGQSTAAAWNDYTSFAAPPSGGSVYYEVRSGTWVNPGHRDHATQLAQQGRMVQVGISWKDNPPGYTGGDENAKAARSRAVTQEIADGRHDAQFGNLIAFVNQYPAAKFFLRVDYEVSSFYHCTDASCASYRNAFAKVRSLINAAKRQDNVTYVFHPVRGEFEKLYPGDAVTDWIGVSVFAHELCLPIYDNGYLYNGTPPQNYDTAASQCRNAYVGTDAAGNPAAVWRNWDHDANVLKMMKFAKDHGKPMIVSEAGMMNFTDNGADTVGLEPQRGDLWVRRLFSLMDYVGPIPNMSGSYDLRGVIRAAVYINLDFRYGWDGVNDGSFDFPVNSTWFVDGRLSRYAEARASFCRGLTERNFVTRCTGSTDRAIVGAGSGRCVDVAGGGTADGTAVQLWDCLGNGAQRWRRAGDTFVNTGSGKCLDVRGVGTADGSQVWLWTCIAGSAAQRWLVNSDGTLVNPNSGKCLDAAGWGTANGTRLQIWACGTNQSNQRWQVI
ncbi:MULTISPECIES: RICIN domain-containing protein [unclassified Micromonospora]|uniref:RICIN domain-containing protein n=1 Tax=unclassified Micromonospora TaxID=2617518 RepID=UPI0020B2F6BC|nr:MULTISPECIES: RICIN domain-containing protein [unclassified Micromonospora]MDM4781390.1 RICIN domain-containing protein [Micromonospora sp. b486]